MEFVNQIMSQQIIPEYVAAEHQDVFAGLAFEFGNLVVRICTPDDASVILLQPCEPLVQFSGISIF